MSESLQERAMRFMQSVARRSGDPFYTVNPGDDFRFVFVNEAACVHFGRPRDELLAMRMSDVDLNCQADQMDRFWAEIREHGSIFYETFHSHANGFTIPVAVSANFFTQGERELFGGCIHDLREQRRTAAALKESEEMLRVIFDSTYDAILLHSPDGYLIDANATFLRMHGVSRDEAVGRHVADFFSPEMPLKSAPALWAKVLAGEPQLFEWKGRRYRSGCDFDVEVYLQKVRFRGEDVILANLRDISARKETEVYLRRAKEAAEYANRVKSELLANTSHELRTPMTVIMGAIEFLLHAGGEPAHRELLLMADQSAKRLLRIIEDLLDLSRIERGRMQLELRPFDLGQCVQETVAMLVRPAQEKGLELAATIEPQVPPQVVGDPARISQVLLNLVGNAVKFTERGSVRVSVDRDGDRLLFAVRDTGVGVPPHQLQEIFEPFAQVNHVGSRIAGTGLGLTICREIVQRMGGEIWAQSEEGAGSTFCFTLPLEQEKVAPPAG